MYRKYQKYLYYVRLFRIFPWPAHRMVEINQNDCSLVAIRDELVEMAVLSHPHGAQER